MSPTRNGVSRRTIVTALACCAAGAGVHPLARAAVFPTKPMRIVAGFPPGGAADLLARVVAERLGSIYSEPVVVDNKPGAGGTVAAGFVSKSPPDGHTLLLGVTASQTIAPAIYPSLAYSAQSDFAPVTLLAQIPVALVVHPSIAARNPKELVALARLSSPQLAFASSGSGAIPHLTAELFKASQSVQMVHVPYRGAAPAMTDLLSGRVPVMFDHLPSVLPHIKSGRLRALGVAGSTRAQALPDLPTLTEAGIAGVEVSSWFGLLAPAGTPQAVVKQLHEDVAAQLQLPDVATRIALLGAERMTSTPDAFAAVIRADSVKWARIVKATGARAD